MITINQINEIEDEDIKAIFYQLRKITKQQKALSAILKKK